MSEKSRYPQKSERTRKKILSSFNSHYIHCINGEASFTVIKKQVRYLEEKLMLFYDSDVQKTSPVSPGIPENASTK